MDEYSKDENLKMNKRSDYRKKNKKYYIRNRWYIRVGKMQEIKIKKKKNKTERR